MNRNKWYNSTIIIYYMQEREPNQEQKSLTKQYLALSEQLDTSPIPDPQVLYEYLATAKQFYQQKTRQAGADHEEAYKEARYFEQLQNGSIQDKWEFCMIRRKVLFRLAQEHMKKGYTELAEQNYTKANNLRELACAIRRGQGSSPQGEG